MEKKLLIDKNKVTIGSDPEVFLIDYKGNAVSAIGKVPGSKDDPEPIVSLGKGFCIQTDCCSVEFNVPALVFDPRFPYLTAERFYENINKVLDYVRGLVGNEYNISLATSKEFSDEDLEHPQATLAGCSTDYNAWELCANKKPDFRKTNTRCNGAHIHIGYEGFNDSISIELIKALDLTLGVTSVLLDSDTKRRELYGRAGCFRMTSFGVEYRVLSPFWLSSIENVEYIFKGISKAIDLVNEGKVYSDTEQLDIQTAININDLDMAAELIKKYNLQSLLPVEVLVY